jgi:hypothetical protein
MKHRSLRLCLFIILAVSPGLAQTRVPRSEDYPVPKRQMYKGKPRRVLLNTRRARTFRTVIREGARRGPNFAGRFTMVTWGAGLGTFAMAVVDARTGKVSFPPFTEVGASTYGLPFIDKGDNPAWRIDSKLFAFVGMPDKGNKGIGLYLYSFDHGRFRFVRFFPDNEKGRRELGHKHSQR